METTHNVYGSNTKVSGGATTNTNGLGVGIGPGFAYFLNQNIALEVLAKYNLTVGFGNSTTINSLNLGLGFQIHLLFSFKKPVRPTQAGFSAFRKFYSKIRNIKLY